MSKSSRTSLRNYGKFVSRARNKNRNKDLLKPYNFCCDINTPDYDTRYDERKPPFTSSLTILSPIQESPTLKFRYQSVEPAIREKRKGSKVKSQQENWNLEGNPCVKTRGPLLWYQEEEIDIAKDEFWSEKQRVYNEEAERNAILGEKKVKKQLNSAVDAAGPRWYQDLSIQQMRQVLSLGDTLTADNEETITVRTRNALAIIGVTSTFFKIGPKVIKKLQRITKLEPINFLREIYKRATGRYFEEEEYKNTYGCNERIILSAIAFLALPDAVIELNNRLPPISKPMFPEKPKPPRIPVISSGLYKSPYKEPLPLPPDWVAYRKCMDAWRVKCSLVPRPKIILPRLKEREKFIDYQDSEYDGSDEVEDNSNFEISENLKKEKKFETNVEENLKNFRDTDTPFDFTVPKLPGGDKQTFDFTISGLGEKSGPVNYKICGTLKPPFPKRKSWLGDKEAHYIISGISEHEDPPQCPVTYVMTGVSYVTPENSDDQFFAELKLGDDGAKKRVYPSGRKNLSKNWQEWLQNADEEFIEVEREANKLIKSVEATMRLVIPSGNRCDACCSCRQTRKANLKAHGSKTPYMVIDSIAEGDDLNRYIVGSLAMHSPAPSPAESTVNLLEVVASKETVQKKLVINGVTNDNGETTFYISGVTQNSEYTPKRTILKERPPKPLRNVPPCACTIEQIFNEGKTAPSESGDDIPQTKKRGTCFGRKYRPGEAAAFTCKEHPDDKSCRRNPFDYDRKLKRESARIGTELRMSNEESDQGPSKGKRMFSMPAFSPCGDEDGMAVCGGPWGKKNIPTPEVLAAREAEAKKILKAPPCGDSPGRAVCGGPWGATNPSLKTRKEEDEEEEDEDEEEEEEEGGKKKEMSPKEAAKLAKDVEAEERKMRRKLLKRDNLCSERFDDEIGDNHASAKKGPPVYCDFDNVWDKTRTAPTVNPWENEYEKSLRLSRAGPNLCSDECKESELSTRRGNNFYSADKDRDLDKNGHRTRSIDKNNMKSRKDNVEVIYGGKLLDEKTVGLGKERTLSTSEKKVKETVKETSRGGKTLKLKDVEVKNTEMDSQRANKGTNNKAKSHQKSNSKKPQKGNTFRKSIKHCGDKEGKESSLKNARVRKFSTQKSRKSENRASRSKEIKSPQVTKRSLSSAKQPPLSLKMDEKFKPGYKVSPAVIPEMPRLPCQRDTANFDEQSDNCGCSDAEETNVETDTRKEGPFGWRTKSQQNLPREKTLVYLAEPGDKVEMVKLREGGRPCKCRENRNKKKILLYNIGGTVNVAKSGRGTTRSQVIEGLTYVTPPQSPRNSEEYIPEYDIFESPYKKCVRKRSDKDLKYINELSTFRSLSPEGKTNAESCPCGREEVDDSPAKEIVRHEDSASSRWSSALKDEGLVEHFVRCKDEVPCWLRCAKFSKAGCCPKPKLLQVKKPVCECKYERRVVKREEEKKQWVDRQRRLKDAKKKPYVEIGGTSRPMREETKLMISSVKKVLKDGEFIPEAQYCVTGVAENYAMGPPQQIIPGITMQSPIVTPEPSKPDISCMCGHRHWSPTDVTASEVPGGFPVRAKGEYPCRGRDQVKVTSENISANLATKETESISSNSESYVGYQNCADHGGACSPVIDEGELQSREKKKRKLISGSVEKAAESVGRSSIKKLKFDSGKVSQNISGGAMRNDHASGIKISKPMKVVRKEIRGSDNEASEPKKSTKSDQQNSSTMDNDADLFELMKVELEKMASEDFVLAKLPECWLIPQLKSWIEYREGKVITDSINEKLCDITSKRWELMRQTKKPSIPPPSLNLSKKEMAKMTFDRAIEMKKKIPLVREKYFSELRQLRVSEARSYWPTMEFGKFPSLSFKEAYFTYLPGKEADGHVFRPWKIGD